LTNNNTKHNNTQKTNQFQPKVINLSNAHFTKQQTRLLSLGPNYAIEKEPERYINELIVETEVAICQINPELQNVYRHLAAKQIKYILATNR
jgi:hypothetical protein